MNRKPAFAAALALTAALAACTTAQTDQATAYQAQIAGVCKIVMSSPWARPWVVTVCESEAAIARFALDPTILAWLNSIADRIKAG